MSLERIGQVMHIHDDFLDAGHVQALENVIEQRLAVHLDQWFGLGRRQRPHSLAKACGNDQRRARLFCHHFGSDTKVPPSAANSTTFMCSVLLSVASLQSTK